MAALDLTLTALDHLPTVTDGTCSATPGNVRRVNISAKRLRYTVFADTAALKVSIPVNGSALADEASGAALTKVTIAIGGFFSFVAGGANRESGLPSVSQFYIHSATGTAPYAIGVDEVGA